MKNQIDFVMLTVFLTLIGVIMGVLIMLVSIKSLPNDEVTPNIIHVESSECYE